jgi:hypothetical protein
MGRQNRLQAAPRRRKQAMGLAAAAVLEFLRRLRPPHAATPTLIFMSIFASLPPASVGCEKTPCAVRTLA